MSTLLRLGYEVTQDARAGEPLTGTDQYNFTSHRLWWTSDVTITSNYIETYSPSMFERR
ncbi:hypothetical protein [Rhodococcus sp. MS16]|uniref:hypothetical protein n=1 Tax=Rhodococcus sp. MS16 TaxID=2579941 RepID=UPI001561E299|nr:hypothetical protein [Rhodococcus sp. MS16]